MAIETCVLMLFAGFAQNGLAAEEPSLVGQEIISRMIDLDKIRAGELLHYASVRSYKLENKRFSKTAEMTVAASYRHPGQKEFLIRSESGLHAIRDRVLHRMLDSELEASREPMRQASQITPENYVFQFAGMGTDRGRRAYMFDISPKSVNKFMIRGRIWLDSEDFAISRIEGKPAKNPSVLIHGAAFVHVYDKFDGFWLPASNASRSDSLLFGHTDILIRYTGYEINPEK